MILADVAVATGWEFSRVAALTVEQLTAVQEAILRQWEAQAAMSGIKTMSKHFGVGGTQLADRLQEMKRTTGRASFDIAEVLT